MTEWAAGLLEQYLGISNAIARNILHVIGAVGAGLLLVLLATIIVASETLLGGQDVSNLHLGTISSQNIRAPRNDTYDSDVLTAQRQEEVAATVARVYDQPDPNVSRTLTEFARQIFEFIINVRNDTLATPDQKIGDIQQITSLTLSVEQIANILSMGAEEWQRVDDETINVLERVMRGSIREVDLTAVRNQLVTQVSNRFEDHESEIIVTILKDLIRPNTFPNDEATQLARQQAAAAVEPVLRTFAANQIIVREGEVIEAADIEALQELGLLEPQGQRLLDFVQAFLACVLVVVTTGLAIARYERHLYQNTRFLLLLAVIFLIVLAAARIVASTGQIYLFPAATLSLLLAALAGSRMALIGTLNLAFLMGVMLGSSLEMGMLAGAGGVMGILMLRSTERLNNFFVSGLMVGLTNTIIVTIFNLGTTSSTGMNLSLMAPFSLINGLFAAAAAIAGLYIVTLLFNLPTSLKLAELNQPNSPLLQRLLREAPGTYQHSLQVANLSEQAALSIGGNAELVRVAALYHDIGKMLNAAFFSENQQFGGGNPHDVLDDPYRSADIIISHVTDGDDLARRYRLPRRFRDFIREHHGTTEVFVFYRKAVNAADGDESAVDIDAFRYPGPNPQSRETAVMMLADSAESAVRSIGPTSKQQVSEIVQDIIQGKMKSGQLDESGLTLNDIKAIRDIFVEMLQAVYHPRIDYKKATATETSQMTQERATVNRTPRSIPPITREIDAKPRKAERTETQFMAKAVETPLVKDADDDVALLTDDDSPMPDVPTLPRSKANGKPETSEQPESTND